jgi:hypothetical protein
MPPAANPRELWLDLVYWALGGKVATDIGDRGRAAVALSNLDRLTAELRVLASDETGTAA